MNTIHDTFVQAILAAYMAATADGLYVEVHEIGPSLFAVTVSGSCDGKWQCTIDPDGQVNLCRARQDTECLAGLAAEVLAAR